MAAVDKSDMRHAAADDADHHRLDHGQRERVAIAASMALPLAASISAPALVAGEIRGLWQWVEARLKVRATVSRQPVSDLATSPRAHNAIFLEASADDAALVSRSGL
jgi:hypothetical protein